MFDANQILVTVIAIKEASKKSGNVPCNKSKNLDDFKKCVDDIHKPYINKIHFNSYEQSYELDNYGTSDLIYPAKYSITVDLAPKLSLNKVKFWMVEKNDIL